MPFKTEQWSTFLVSPWAVGPMNQEADQGASSCVLAPVEWSIPFPKSNPETPDSSPSPVARHDSSVRVRAAVLPYGLAQPWREGILGGVPRLHARPRGAAGSTSRAGDMEGPGRCPAGRCFPSEAQVPTAVVAWCLTEGGCGNGSTNLRRAAGAALLDHTHSHGTHYKSKY